MPASDAAEGAGAAERASSTLDAIEQELTQGVPSLLEAMNRASDEVNNLERQLTEAQDRYRRLLEQWSRLYEELRAQHGAAIDRVRPYFDAAQVLNAASRRVQGVVREFSAAASMHAKAKTELRRIEEDLAYGAHRVTLDRDQQDGLSRATVSVLRCQQERDRREQEYVRALREYQEAQESLEAWRSQIGDALIKRTLPSFRQLQKHQTTLATEQSRINALTERAKHSKSVYNNSLRELDRINMSVHAARKEHSEAAVSAPPPQKAPACPPEESPEARLPPGIEHRGKGDEEVEAEPEEVQTTPEVPPPSPTGGAGPTKAEPPPSGCSQKSTDERPEAVPELSPEGACS